MDQDIDIIRQATACKADSTGKLRLGVTMVVAALLLMLTGLTWNSVLTTHNLSDVLHRRSPIIEYLVCFNSRVVERDIAMDNLLLLSPHGTSADTVELAKAEAALRVASDNLKEANTKGSPLACPNIP